MSDEPRFLHSHPAYGYTSDPTRAAFGEPEALSEAAERDLQAAADRAERDRQVREWEARRHLIQRQVAWLTSQRFRTNVRSQLRALEHQLAQLDHLIRR